MAGHKLNDEKRRTVDVEFDESLFFEKMFLSESVVRGLTRNNFVHPSPIQARAIPLGKLGLDLLVQAKSGTGKTIVFAVLIAEAHNPDVTFPQSLTVVPTREIAVQIEKVLNMVGYSVPNFRARSFIGGLDLAQDRKNLQGCSAVVGTPGRINHLIQSNVLNTSHMNILVLDEADSLISGNLKSDVEQIVKTLPNKRQTIVCSATYYNNKDRELLRYLNDKFLGVTPKKEVPVLHGICQFVRELPEMKDNVKEMMAKIAELNQILKKLPFSQCLLFANTQTKAETYSSYLNRAGWQTELIRGGQEQRVRLKTVENLKEFRCRILAATDVIARGIDAENVNLVINVDVPKDNSTYLHRIGRSGRFGTQAIAITLVSSQRELERFRKILYDIGGNEMFVYKLPTEALDEIWKFELHEDKYSKLYASKLEQEIREQGADRVLLETIQEVDSRTELECKSNETLENGLKEPKKQVQAIMVEDNIDQLRMEKQSSSETLNEVEEEVIQRIIPLRCSHENLIDADKSENEEMLQPRQITSEGEQTREEDANIQDNVPEKSSIDADDIVIERSQLEDDESSSVTQESTQESISAVDRMFAMAIQKLNLGDNDQPEGVELEDVECGEEADTEIDQMFMNAMSKLKFEDSAAAEQISAEFDHLKNSTSCKSNESDQSSKNNDDAVDKMFLDAMKKQDCEISSIGEYSEETGAHGEASYFDNPQVSQRVMASPELSCTTPESCYTTDSSFSSDATKKVEVGSNFTTPNSRVLEIRHAAPTHQISSSTSDDASEASQTSDAAVPAEQSCLQMEVNNDALFAKIMEQKELDAGQLQRPFQFSIDGCSLEVHDDAVSDRDSRKESVPDVVPGSSSRETVRLLNRPSSGDEETAGFDLNSNTCGSNHGSVFDQEEEEAVVAEENRPKRIRFEQDDLSVEPAPNAAGMNDGERNQQGGEQPEPDSLGHPPKSDAIVASEDAEDASSYSSEYDSESTNSYFFDQREWESETSKDKKGRQTRPQTQQTAASKTDSGRSRDRKRSKDATNLYHRTYGSWTTQYWNQMTMIRDYARFALYSRTEAREN
ncbi:probable ATP-dependent RNA helicase DDX20 [Toxorhynchites rutilus septentrionalis]|uniref:probable ATP-dependent RNA helicase DDX20 n=1 Tax=Toxorhynchites rutilus septentrionalis TaxID=329112 RepID=UPI002479C0F5|nr:probable ATP-dependent RNA helicase DDX20 [Toxorhynchites rutilus septentrionalis]